MNGKLYHIILFLVPRRYITRNQSWYVKTSIQLSIWSSDSWSELSRYRRWHGGSKECCKARTRNSCTESFWSVPWWWNAARFVIVLVLWFCCMGCKKSVLFQNKTKQRETKNKLKMKKEGIEGQWCWVVVVVFSSIFTLLLSFLTPPDPRRIWEL